MDYVGFCGPSHPGQSVLAGWEKTVNWYLEQTPAGPALLPTPGAVPFLETASSHVEPRALKTVQGRVFAVIGTGFYELFEGGGKILRGTVDPDSALATISYNGIAGGQLFITSGGTGSLFTLTTNVFAVVLSAGHATMGGMLNARFLAFSRITGKVLLSALNDGSTWDATLYFQRSAAPDPWQAMVINGSEIWMIGEETGEVWYDSGAFPQPFALIAGSSFPFGTSAPFSAGVVRGNVMWVTRTGTIVAARGYTPQPISNFAVETATAQYLRDDAVRDAELLSYDDHGHTFACFSFPQARATWAADLSMGMAWHERGTWDSLHTRFNAWAPRVYTFGFNKHLVGNRGSDSIARMDVTYGSEADGGEIRRVRVPPALRAEANQRLIASRLQVHFEPGLGLLSGQGSDPVAMLRTSKDGKTWSAERRVSTGRRGDYTRRIIWHRCGSSDGIWVPEVTTSDPIPFRCVGASIDGAGIQAARRAA